MRSAVAVAAFAAGALAVPYKRDMVTDIDMVFATDIVTVYATANNVVTATSTAIADAAPAASTEAASSQAQHYGHHGGWSRTSQVVGSSTSATSAPYVAPTTSSTPVYVAPTTSSTSIYVAPTTSSTWVAPTTSVATSAPAYSAPSPSTQAPTSTAQATASASSYSDIAVLHHNVHRSNHSADPLAWSDDLAKSAADIAASCVYAHNVDADGGGYGQNIAAGVEPANISAIITDLFYNGEVGWYNGLYGQAQPDMTNFENWGHFSQIVWKDTKFVGCATQHCPNGLANVGDDVSPYFTVCNYKGPGNYANEYGDNIGSPLNHPTADWNYGLSS